MHIVFFFCFNRKHPWANFRWCLNCWSRSPSPTYECVLSTSTIESLTDYSAVWVQRTTLHCFFQIHRPWDEDGQETQKLPTEKRWPGAVGWQGQVALVHVPADAEEPTRAWYWHSNSNLSHMARLTLIHVLSATPIKASFDPIPIIFYTRINNTSSSGGIIFKDPYIRNFMVLSLVYWLVILQNA